MNKISKIFLAAGVTVVLLAGKVYALGASATYGFNVDNPSCWSIGWDTVQNQCSASLHWQIPLSAKAGSHTVAVYAQNNSGTLSCQLKAIFQYGEVASTASGNLPSGTGTKNITVTVPTNGSLLVDCALGLNDELFSVDWAE